MSDQLKVIRCSTPPFLTIEATRPSLRDYYRDGLIHDTLPFWFPRCIDHEHGGFLHYLDRDGTRIDSDKSVWAHGRMSWMLLRLAQTISDPGLRELCIQWSQSGVDFLERHCFDSDGRMFFHVARDGSPIRKRRYAYSEAFAAIAIAAWAKHFGDVQAANRAWALFEQFVGWNFQPDLMPPKFAKTRPMIGLAPRMITIVTAQELRELIGHMQPQRIIDLEQWIDRCIHEIQSLFFHREHNALLESVGPFGEFNDHADGRVLNPGHAMEAAWFILREGQVRGRSDWVQFGCELVNSMWHWGWDSECGGIWYFRDVLHRPPQEYWHDMKFWWPHNETIIATLWAFLATKDPKYAEWHDMCLQWSHSHFYDPQFGEWFGYLHRDGSLSTTTKGNLWKSFFHFPRMQWTCWQLLESHLGNGLT